VALSCDLDPNHEGVAWKCRMELEHISGRSDPDIPRGAFIVRLPPMSYLEIADDDIKLLVDRFAVAANNVIGGSLQTADGALNGQLRLADFARFAHDTGWDDLPPRFPGRIDGSEPRSPRTAAPTHSVPNLPIADLAAITAHTAMNPGQPKALIGTWPWGTYENELLRHLADAVQYFWAQEEDRRAPALKDDVVEWLVKRGVSKGKAEAIALVIRPDNIAPGPRKKDE